MTLPRVVARDGSAVLVETRARDGRRYACVYHEAQDKLWPEMLLGSIVAMGNGGWIEVEPDAHSDLVDRLSSRLADVT